MFLIIIYDIIIKNLLTNYVFVDEVLKKDHKIRELLLQIMIDNNWSDMYITVWSVPAIKIWWDIVRINEWINEFNAKDTLDFTQSLITKAQFDKLEETKNLDFSFSFADRRFRCNISFQMSNYMVVLRLLANDIPSIDALWLTDVYKEVTKRGQWLILVTWPTWSGKTTTLSAMINYINENYNKHIITIEDPIEYVHTHKKSIMEQKEIWRDVLNYKGALMWAMRQNPQVIFFWEMRSKEEIEMALTLAETWHLVLSTLHTRSATQTISRIIDTFNWSEQTQVRLQLADSLVAVFSQRLLRLKEWGWIKLAKEILLKNWAVANLIRENELHQIPSVIQMWSREWMQLLETDIIEFINSWIITEEEWYKYSNNPKYIKESINS